MQGITIYIKLATKRQQRSETHLAKTRTLLILAAQAGMTLATLAGSITLMAVFAVAGVGFFLFKATMWEAIEEVVVGLMSTVVVE